MKKLLLLVLFALLGSASAFSQTYNYSYKYMCSVTEDGDEIKSPYLNNGVVFDFRLTNNGSMCYLVDDDGQISDLSKYVYVGVEDDMLAYEENSEIILSGGPDFLYFSRDYSELYWDCALEKSQNVKSIRYLVRED